MGKKENRIAGQLLTDNQRRYFFGKLKHTNPPHVRRQIAKLLLKLSFIFPRFLDDVWLIQDRFELKTENEKKEKEKNDSVIKNAVVDFSKKVGSLSPMDLDLVGIEERLEELRKGGVKTLPDVLTELQQEADVLFLHEVHKKFVSSNRIIYKKATKALFEIEELTLLNLKASKGKLIENIRGTKWEQRPKILKVLKKFGLVGGGIECGEAYCLTQKGVVVANLLKNNPKS